MNKFETFVGAMLAVGLLCGGCSDEGDSSPDANVVGDASGGNILDAPVVSPKLDAAVDTSLAVDARVDAADAAIAGDAAADSASDAGGADASCNLGTAQSAATSGNLNLFGTIVYFEEGINLPAGLYEATYLDGCMKYGGDQGWAVHAYADPGLGWYLVGDTSSDRIAHLPGAVGYAAYPVFDDCVNAGKAMAPVQFQHAGGKIGVWLYDSNYGDNLVGVDGRNPKWRLSRLNALCE